MEQINFLCEWFTYFLIFILKIKIII
jgi:hypothetical protein